MSPTDVIEVSREAILTMLTIGAPIMALALGVGLLISLFQALTQIQEMTLAFVPKIIIIFLSLIAMAPFMLATMVTYGESLMDRIVALG